MKLETTKEKVLEAASKSMLVKIALKSLFPEAFVFDDDKIVAKIGDRFYIEDVEYILARISHNQICLIALDCGNRYTDPVNYSLEHVTFKVFKSLLQDNSEFAEKILETNNSMIRN